MSECQCGFYLVEKGMCSWAKMYHNNYEKCRFQFDDLYACQQEAKRVEEEEESRLRANSFFHQQTKPDQPQDEGEEKMETQSRICPECHDDHATFQPHAFGKRRSIFDQRTTPDRRVNEQPVASIPYMSCDRRSSRGRRVGD